MTQGEPKVCETCGCHLIFDGSSGLCPKCLLIGGISSVGDTGQRSVQPEINKPFTPQGLQGAAPCAGQTDIAQTAIGPYRLVSKLGEGGFGVVWLAEQSYPLKRKVAIKLVKVGVDSDEVAARFALERQTVALMDHAHIARVFDAGVTDEGRSYFVMELVEGKPLTCYCDEVRLAIRERLELFVLVCEAVQHAHQKGVIHRDLKPSNILVATSDEGRPVPKVIDFGIAKALAPDFDGEPVTIPSLGILGTPVYMSPEQALGGVGVDTRSDLYSLGVILYELLTGQPPLDLKELKNLAIDDVIRKIREEEALKPSSKVKALGLVSGTRIADARGVPWARLFGILSGDLDWIVLKSLEKDRERRYATAAAFANDLRRYLNGDTVEAAPPSAAYRAKKFILRNRVPVTAAALVCMALLGAVGASAKFALDAEAARRAEAERAFEAEASRDEARAISNFLVSAFRSPDPERDGRGITVVEILDQAVQSLAEDGQMDVDRRASLERALGETFEALGEFPEAIRLKESVHRRCEAKNGRDHPDTVDSLNSVAIACLRAGQMERAEQLLKRVFEVKTRLLGAGHPDSLRVLGDLASAKFGCGLRGDALVLRQELHEEFSRQLGEDHPDTLAAKASLAHSLSDAGRFSEALRLREGVYQAKRRLFGQTHQETLAAAGNLAVSYAENGRREESMSLRRWIFETSRDNSGLDHPETLRAAANLAISLSEANFAQEALELREIVWKARSILPEGHPARLRAKTSLANSYFMLDMKAIALRLRKSVLEESMVSMGEDNRNEALTAAANLADSYFDDNQVEEGIRLRIWVYETSRASLGEDHPETFTAKHRLAESHSLNGDHEEAIALQRQLIEICRRKMGEDHPMTLHFLTHLGICHRRSGDLEMAINIISQSLTRLRNQLPPSHPQVLAALESLAECLIEKGDEAGIAILRGEAAELAARRK